MKFKAAAVLAVGGCAAMADWHYPQMCMEAYRLREMQAESRRAEMYAAHPGRVAEFGNEGRFRRKAAPGEKCGYTAVRRHRHEYKDGYFYVWVNGTYMDAPALRSDLGGWEAMAIDGKWRAASRYADSETPPHLQGLEEVRGWEKPAFRDGYWDTGRLLLAYVECTAEKEPLMFAGESVPEMMSEDRKNFEYCPKMREVAPGRWRSTAALSVQYFRFKGEVSDVGVTPVMRKMETPGKFAAPDGRTTKMRDVGAHTFRVCALDFMVDGLKRDRLPWGGDITVSILADAYLSGDAEIARRSLSILDAYETDVNGIVTYSMWTLVAHDLYQLYFGDGDFLSERWWRIKWRAENLISRCDENGFVAKGLDWVFIDWTGDTPLATAMHTVWAGALDATARLAERAGDPDAARYREFSAKVKGSINRLAWDEERGLYRADPFGKAKAFGRHANIFGALFGVADAAKTKRIAAELAKDALPPVGTPYIFGWEMCVLARNGHAKEFFAGMEKVFGGMLDAGATTFWEGYRADQKGNDMYKFYGRPWAKSLCHVWSSWPAFIYVSEAMGVRPTSDGWATHEVKPVAGAEGMRAEVPTPRGTIKVEIPGK